MMWHLADIRGTRPVVRSKIEANTTIPADAKALIISQIDDLAPDITACRLDAYCQEAVSASEVQRVFQVTLKGFKL